MNERKEKKRNKERNDTVAVQPTTTRVKLSTKNTVNNSIQQKTMRNISRYLNRSNLALTKRIDDLNYEWDTERVLETSSSVIVVFSIGLGFMFKKVWFVVSGVISFFLLVHALFGWCPPLPIIRRKGIRTMVEICEEKTALKKLRGDFSNEVKDPEKLLLQSKLT